jgi:hypothetical protein
MDPLTIISLVLTVVSLAYAYKTNRDKDRLEKMLRISFERLQAGIDNAKANNKLAYDHLDGIRRFVQDLPPSPGRADILERITWLHGDVTAADRLLVAVRTDVDSVSRGLFDSHHFPRRKKLPPGSEGTSPPQQQVLSPKSEPGGPEQGP